MAGRPQTTARQAACTPSSWASASAIATSCACPGLGSLLWPSLQPPTWRPRSPPPWVLPLPLPCCLSVCSYFLTAPSSPHRLPSTEWTSLPASLLCPSGLLSPPEPASLGTKDNMEFLSLAGGELHGGSWKAAQSAPVPPCAEGTGALTCPCRGLLPGGVTPGLACVAEQAPEGRESPWGSTWRVCIGEASAPMDREGTRLGAPVPPACP